MSDIYDFCQAPGQSGSQNGKPYGAVSAYEQPSQRAAVSRLLRIAGWIAGTVLIIALVGFVVCRVGGRFSAYIGGGTAIPSLNP